MIKSLYEEKRMRVESSCKVLRVSRSGYYKWRDEMPAESQAGGVIEALKMAIGKEHLVAGLIVHTDQGVQYACGSYRALIELYGYKMSMSRKGNCYDNAFIESFFRSLKVELIHRQVFKTSQEAQAAIFHYIGVWHNKQRRHSSLTYMSPVDYERLLRSLHIFVPTIWSKITFVQKLIIKINYFYFHPLGEKKFLMICLKYKAILHFYKSLIRN